MAKVTTTSAIITARRAAATRVFTWAAPIAALVGRVVLALFVLRARSVALVTR